MRKLMLVPVMLSGFAICQPNDVDGWSKAKWGMTIAEAKAAFGSDAPGEVSANGAFMVEHVEIGSIVTKGAAVRSKQNRVSSVQINVTLPLDRVSSSQRSDMFSTLKTLLIEKYGVPKNEDRKPDGNGSMDSTVLWSFPSTSITLFWSQDSRYGQLGYILITYQAVDKKALDAL